MPPRNRDNKTGLTDGELRIMQVLWAHGPSTVLEIQERLEDALEDSSIRTFLAILERKGKVAREKRGRSFVYEAAAGRADTRERAVKQLIRKFFSDPKELVLSVVNSDELSRDELLELRKALDRASKKGGSQ